MENSLNEMQSMMLDMIKWFHSFCLKHNIKYYVVGGTMLGAVRHKGFIPWDDDVDIAIPRNDYEKLLANKEIWLKDEKRYFLESYHDGNDDFAYPYAKVYDIQTSLVEKNRHHTKRGIFIDVFPLDGIGPTREDAIINYSTIQKKLNLLFARTLEVKKNRKMVKNVAIVISRLIPSFMLSNHKLIAKIDKLCSVRDFESSNYVGNLVGNWGIKEIMPRQYLGTPTLYRFEDTEVFGPENYDDYLTNVYNNWRQLPPIEKQKSDHNYLFVDLHKPYVQK